jgi:hypothetical protein
MTVKRVILLGTLALALVGYGATWAVADDGDERVALQPAFTHQSVVAQDWTEPPPTPGWTTAISPGGDGSQDRLERRAAARAFGIGPGQPNLPTMRRENNGTTSMQAKCRYRVYRTYELPRISRYEVLSRCNASGY